MQQKIVLIGGPGTGKTSVINILKQKRYTCMEEVSRQVTLEAKEQGIDQLFLEKPILFSEKLLEGRENQFKQAVKLNDSIVFFDRGIPSVYAYLKYFDTPAPAKFILKTQEYQYQKVFLFNPWKQIYTSDNERYETFEQSIKITKFIINTYKEFGYNPIEVPFGAVKDRTQFILNSLSLSE